MALTEKDKVEMQETIAQAIIDSQPKQEIKKPRRSVFTWIADGLTINETKTSSLILIMLLFVGLGIFQVIKIGDVSQNLTEIIKWSLMAVAGASGLNAMASNNNNMNY